MFDEIELDGEKVNAFFDIENMRFYINQNWEGNSYEDDSKTKIVKINNNIICIDTDDNYIGVWNDTKYYNVLYYFNFQTLEYIDGIEKITKIQYYSEVVDAFLLPHATEDEKIKEEVNEIFFRFQNKKVNGIINRKNYRRLYTDLSNTKSFIECKFENTDNWEYIYDLCIIIEDFLKITLYTKHLYRPLIKIFNSNDEEMGKLIINEKFYKKDNINLKEGKFEGVIEKNCEKIFDFLCNNSKLNLSNMREDDFCYNRVFNTKSIYNLYSAFEIESSKIYRKKDIIQVNEDIKNKIVDFSKNLEEYKENKQFIDGLINDRIKDYGIGYGHKEKLKKSIEDYIKVIPERTEFYELNDKVKEIVDTVYELRTDIIHDNFIPVLSHEQNRYVEYFEWIVYVMQLKRMNISNEDIEEMLNLTFGVG